MKHPKHLLIKDYTYVLPEERIAKFPLPERDQSKLLIYDKGNIQPTIYQHIADHLPANTLLVFNDTRVFEARLIFKKKSGAFIEIFCLEPDACYADITSAMLQQGKVRWKCLVGGANKWKHGMVLEKELMIESSSIILRARIVERLTDSFIIEFSWNSSTITFAEILHAAGVMPLPPYLHRAVVESDKERYQTIYANQDGSVAAPTAGLHFTQQIFDELNKKTIAKSFVTLHVGAGTFKPVKSEAIAGHEMHAEFIDVGTDTIEQIIDHLDKNIVAVGTTSTRTLESLYWIGVKLHQRSKMEKINLSMEELCVGQWEPYDAMSNLPAKEALETLLHWMKENKIWRLITKTQIMIAPGYQFKVVKALITNFHQPQSTLLLLLAAMVGDDWRKIYKYAMDHEFRFLSYGDGCLLIP